MTKARLRDLAFIGAVVVSALIVLALAACASPAATPTPQPKVEPTAAPKTEPAASPKVEPAAAPKSKPATAPDAAQLQALIDGARKEGQLRLVWAETNIGGNSAVQKWAQGFKKLYGLDIKIEFTPGDDMARASSRLVQEYQAGRTPFTDVFVGGESHIGQVAFAAVEALEPIDWTKWAPNIQDPGLVAPGGVAVELATRTPSITYNSKKITGNMVPKTMADLLKPEYKGRIASTPYAANFDRLATDALWGEKRTVEYITKLSEQVSGLIRCGEEERVASGEFDIFALECGNYYARMWKAKGAPLDSVIPSDAALVAYWYMAVPKNAVNPNAAKLWINYVMSREGQDILYEHQFTDHYAVPGSKSADELKKLEATGVKPTHVDVEMVINSDAKELGRIREVLQKILAKQ